MVLKALGRKPQDPRSRFRPSTHRAGEREREKERKREREKERKREREKERKREREKERKREREKERGREGERDRVGLRLRSTSVPRTQEELKAMVGEADEDGSGEIEFPEFLKLMAAKLHDMDSVEEKFSFGLFNARGRL